MAGSLLLESPTIVFLSPMRLPGNPHPYLLLRLRLTHHALHQFVASLASSVEILVLLAGPLLLGLLSVLALPCLHAATLPWPAALAIIGAQALATCLPAWLLRKRLLPAPVAAWLRALPLTPALRWQADAGVAAMLMAPLALAYAASAGVWLYQSPAWLRPVAAQGMAAIGASWLLSWLLTACIFKLRMAAPRLVRQASQTAAIGLAPVAPRWTTLFVWRRLFWLPFWRAENMVGIQQSLLLAGAVISMLAWLLRVPLVPAPLLALLASASLVLITDRGDKAVREQLTLLRPSLAAWPIACTPLIRLACAFSLLPGFAVLIAAVVLLQATTPAVLQQRVALVYACTASCALLAIVGLPRLSARARVALVVFAILILTAIGSELWN